MTPVRVNLALQGGGAHGAFTWGVLDRLLEEERLEIAAISGTSAGALNGAALKSGLVRGGRDGAKAALDALWGSVGQVGDMRMSAWMQPALPFAAALTDAWEAAFKTSPQGIAAQLFSPYAMGGAWKNPLAPVVASFDYDSVCCEEGPRLFVNATNVRDGKLGLFSGPKITPEALMASACLPTAFQAVEAPDPLTGKMEAWWDGGYSGNPALFPLYDKGLPDDLIIVAINPLYRVAIPETPLEIQNRINEISFNAPLMRDLRAIAFVKRLLTTGAIKPGDMKDVALHLIADDALMNTLSASSKLLPTPSVLARLKEAGRVAADAFLAKDGPYIGKCGTVDPAALLD
ncbi:patatin-like phospholipase family protein [Pseudorhodobacter turbinis]|uniref:Patatin-like phospholipase family protein n=1 Tax=Pseudorhodobacter turbinis TaxID=2500533 RepID=A0A4P8EDV3_9RHOB|nr:patatin-like phospholipase family protein [Pseudorhodobacter turbinis]QCO54877.1 patatin-like phospholipase family protein [Pseudorhodobacter turbinis]